MQEDVVGTLRTAFSKTNTLVICARCGKAIRKRDAHVIQSDVLETSNSEFEYVCRIARKH